jgi:RNA polymerase sigma-70 factor (ECF subfamily)
MTEHGVAATTDAACGALDRAIAAAFADATSFHGDLGLTFGLWHLRVRSILEKSGRHPDGEAAAIFVDRLHARDLYLATSCAASYDSAWRRFEQLYQRHIRDLVRYQARNPLQATDVGEAVLVDLFLPDRSGQSRIGSYDGRSSLATWLHVIVTHRVANERVRKWNTVERPGDMPDVPDRSLISALEESLGVQRYAHALDSALRMVCARLSDRERQILVWRYERGWLLEQIAARLDVHTSTACRQLERLHARIRKDVIATLSETYGMPPDAVAECLDGVAAGRALSVPLLGIIGDGLTKTEETSSHPREQIA